MMFIPHYTHHSLAEFENSAFLSPISSPPYSTLRPRSQSDPLSCSPPQSIRRSTSFSSFTKDQQHFTTSDDSVLESSILIVPDELNPEVKEFIPKLNQLNVNAEPFVPQYLTHQETLPPDYGLTMVPSIHDEFYEAYHNSFGQETLPPDYGLTMVTPSHPEVFYEPYQNIGQYTVSSQNYDYSSDDGSTLSTGEVECEECFDKFEFNPEVNTGFYISRCPSFITDYIPLI